MLSMVPDPVLHEATVHLEALWLFWRAKISWDLIGFNSTLSSFEKGAAYFAVYFFVFCFNGNLLQYLGPWLGGRQWQLAVQMFHLMPAYHITPDRVGYSVPLQTD